MSGPSVFQMPVTPNNEVKQLFLPPGFRFNPTDPEIIDEYLSVKVANPGFTPIAMGDVDLNKCEPWDLPSMAKMGEKVWYFFCQKDMKYPTGTRANRATKHGYWKATGKDKGIYRAVYVANKKKDVLIGMKKTLVFYTGRAPKGQKSNWVMHEFRLEGVSKESASGSRITARDEWVVCRVNVKKNSDSNSGSTIAEMDPTSSDQQADTDPSTSYQPAQSDQSSSLYQTAAGIDASSSHNPAATNPSTLYQPAKLEPSSSFDDIARYFADPNYYYDDMPGLISYAPNIGASSATNMPAFSNSAGNLMTQSNQVLLPNNFSNNNLQVTASDQTFAGRRGYEPYDQNLRSIRGQGMANSMHAQTDSFQNYQYYYG